MTNSIWWTLSPVITSFLAAICFYFGRIGAMYDRTSIYEATGFEVNQRRLRLFANVLGLLFISATSALTLYIVLDPGI